MKQSCESDKVHASEGLFAYHSVIHGHSFQSADCTAKLIKKLYDPKFSSARTKSEAIICNVLDPLSEEEVQHDLDKCSFVTFTVDASNHKDIKLFPVLVRYYLCQVRHRICKLPTFPMSLKNMALLRKQLHFVLITLTQTLAMLKELVKAISGESCKCS